MRLKCYDAYRKQHLIIEPMDDEIWGIDATSSNYCIGNIGLRFNIDGDGEDPHPKRWSDLTDFEIIK